MRRSPPALWVRSLGIGFLGIALAWWMLDATRSRSQWLELSVSRPLVAGQAARFAVRLGPDLREGVVTLDLHWRTRQRVDRKVLATGRPSVIESTGSEHGRRHEFDFTLPADPDLGAVVAVIYVGPSGRWTERSRAAFSEPLDVAPPGSAQAKVSELVPTPVYAPAPGTLPSLEKSPWARYVGAGILLLAAVGGLWQRGSGPKTTSPGSLIRECRERLGSVGLPLVLSTLALGEGTSAASALTGRLRGLAKAHQWYAFRQDFQRPLTLLAVGLGVGGMVWILQTPMSRAARVAWLGAAAYLLLQIGGALSLHEFDALMAGAVGPVTVFEGLKLLAAAVTLTGVAVSRRSYP